MKNLKTLLTMAIVALMSLSFTSCDEDACLTTEKVYTILT